MTYKGMLLSALLVPVAVTCYGQDSVDSRIQQLKDARYQKELELSELGAKIAEKYEFLEEMLDDARHFFQRYVKEAGLDTDKATECGLEEAKERKELLSRLRKAIKEGSVKGFLDNELFDDRDIDENIEFVRLYYVRYFFERKLIVELVEHCDDCMQELIEIDCELDVLQEEVL